ncbi:septum formation protein Maf [Patescibacteria group bacterium]|nr:septum formation protein Maf [Patescibacteria group bacterium]
MKPIVLASTSPRRKEILAISGLQFTTAPSDYEEDMSLNLKPTDLAKHLSQGKAQAIIKDHPNHIIIGADTFVALDNELLGKPKTTEKAVEMLNKINGQVVSVITGFTIIDTSSNQQSSKAVVTKVFINNLTSQEIINYTNSREPLDKAGAFAIQGLGALIVKKIEGDYFNVMGLPLFDLAQELKKYGVIIL